MESQTIVQRNEAVVRRYFELFNAHRWEDMAALYAPTAQCKDPTLGPGIVEFVASGTAPDGSPFELPIAAIFTIENGVITHDFTYYDNVGEG